MVKSMNCNTVLIVFVIPDIISWSKFTFGSAVGVFKLCNAHVPGIFQASGSPQSQQPPGCLI